MLVARKMSGWPGASLLLCLLPACSLWGAATPLAVVKPTVSDRDGGAAVPGSFVHDPGETMFFSFQVDGFTASSAERVHLTYKMDALDPHGVRLMEPVAAEIEETLAPEDKNWKPTVRQEIVIPPLAGSGTYKIAISVTDLIGKATATTEVPFEVHGRRVDPSDTLVIRNIRFLRGEEDKQALSKAAYRPGDAVWARFDIIGFKYGDANAIDVSYDVAVLAANGKVLYSQPQAGSDRSQSFYPKRYVPAVFSLATKPDTHPGEYTVAITAHDGVGNQTFEARQSFRIE
ncbi:MAG: hypothetical protein ABSC93_23505 [Bryobacteraceae bacterium]|jgi:hypothetical protein